jgi:NADH dehydrogenase FAD-containing subunit
MSLNLKILNVITPFKNGNLIIKNFSTNSRVMMTKDSYKLVIVGGGSGGITMSSKFKRYLGPDNIAIIDDAQKHYYQPGWTLVGGGIRKAEDYIRDEKSLIPTGVDWIQSKVDKFDPDNNNVTLKDGKKVTKKR